MKLKDKQKQVVIVTGATSGMGMDIAKRLLKEGYIVYGAGRRTEKLDALVNEGAFALSLDLTNENTIEEAVKHIVKKEHRIDVLVNCAGYGQYGAIEDVPMVEARRQLEVNLFGLARLTQLCLPMMRERNAVKIINISSIGGKIYTPLGGWYHASKFALEGWSDVLRNEVRGFGIDVVVIEPGGIETEWGSIAALEAERFSGNSPYRKLVSSFLEAKSKLGAAPSPSVISDIVLKALTADKPKPRYVGGQLARPLLFLRWLLSDCMFDRIIMSSFR